MSDEFWKGVFSPYERYEISSYGNCRNKITGRALRPLSIGGYKAFVLQGPSKQKEYLAHRLVALAFLSNNEGAQAVVHHKNGVRDDNRIENLEWASVSKNAKLAKKSAPTSKNLRPVAQHTVAGEFVKNWQSLAHAVKGLGLKKGAQSKIGECCKGRRKTCGGFCWSFIAPDIIKGEAWKDLTVNGVTLGISSAGRIRGERGKVVYGSKTDSGYMRAEAGGRKFMVHRLVAEAFLPAPTYGQSQVNHLNNERLDNRVENLEWISPSDNSKHSAYLRWKSVIASNLKTSEIRIFNSVKEAAAILGMCSDSVTKVLRNRRPSCKSWTFTYQQEPAL